MARAGKATPLKPRSRSVDVGFEEQQADLSQFAVSIATQPGFVHSEAFREVAESVHHGLRALGHDSVLSDRTDLPRPRATSSSART